MHGTEQTVALSQNILSLTNMSVTEFPKEKAAFRYFTPREIFPREPDAFLNLCKLFEKAASCGPTTQLLFKLV